MIRFNTPGCDCYFDLDINAEYDEETGRIFPTGDYDLADHINLECACGHIHNLNEFSNGELQLRTE